MNNKMVVDVVMVSKTCSDYFFQMTCNAIDSLLKSEDNVSWNITLIEDNKNYHKDRWKYPAYVRVIVPMFTLNYNRYLQAGIREGKNEWCLLVNNDLIFQKNWFTEIMKVYNHFGGKVESFGTWNERTHGELFSDRKPLYAGYRTYYEMSGWCIVVRRKLLEQINFYNPKNTRVTFWYSDNLFADLLQRWNKVHLLVRDAKVDHLESTTLKTLSQQEQIKLTHGQASRYR